MVKVKNAYTIVLFIVATFIMGCSYGIAAQFENVTFQWDYENTEKNSDVTGFRIYKSAVSGVYEFSAGNTIKEVPYIIDNALAQQTIQSIVNVPIGSWFFVVTAFDSEGNESSPSEEVQFLVKDITYPDAPLNLKVVIVISIN